MPISRNAAITIGVVGAAASVAGVAIALRGTAKSTTSAPATGLVLKGASNIVAVVGAPVTAALTFANTGAASLPAQTVKIGVSLAQGGLIEDMAATVGLPAIPAGSTLTRAIKASGTVTLQAGAATAAFALPDGQAVSRTVTVQAGATSATPPATPTSGTTGTATQPTTSPTTTTTTTTSSAGTTVQALEAEASTLSGEMNAISAEIQKQEAVDGENAATILADPVIQSLTTQWDALAAEYETVQKKLAALGV